MNLVLLGAPGVGKGTQAKLLSEGLSIPHISTGDMLRDEIKKETDLGIEARRFLESGELVPDVIVNQIIRKRLRSSDAQKGFILDGFPRNFEQAKVLDAILEEDSKKIDVVVYLEASPNTIFERLTGRRVCKTCGANFHIKNMPPKKENICDFCGGQLYQRKDDNKETIENRLNIYTQKTEPVVKYYQDQGKLKRVDSNPEAEKVNQVLMDLFARDYKDDSNKVATGN
jgi:adenylate kinase